MHPPATVYEQAETVPFSPSDVPAQPLPSRVLLTTPEAFEVRYVLNPHMQDHLGAVDRAAAWAQWEALRAAYQALGLTVTVTEGLPDLPDMVFCANQTLPFLRGAVPGVVLGRMFAPERRAEVAAYADFFHGQGYDVQPLPAGVTGTFEGMGDALWHPGRALLWGGYGFRTHPSVYPALTRLLDVPVLALRLDDPYFYHLDTCLCLLDAQTALACPTAFQPEGWALLRRLFPRLLEAPEAEARHRLACNAHCPDGQHVLLQRGCTETVRLLRTAGFTPLELDTSEFLKAGGSVFCMKLLYW
jgi:N-dimethylarginine dimethylaminohydrolase